MEYGRGRQTANAVGATGRKGLEGGPGRSVLRGTAPSPSTSPSLPSRSSKPSQTERTATRQGIHGGKEGEGRIREILEGLSDGIA
jgi:hypothetical protein